jgi:hypothetical protein
MTTTDYLINIVLIGFVVLQLRGGRLTLRTALRPVICVAAAAIYYLQGIPTAGNDIVLDLVLGTVGLALGIACAMTTRVWKDREGFQYSKAGIAAAALWVIGIGSRMAFEEYWSHGGTHSIENFSLAHDITSQNAWVAALVIMALAEVISRLVVIRLRAARTTTIDEPTPANTKEVVAA